MERKKEKVKKAQSFDSQSPDSRCYWKKNPHEQANLFSKLFFIWILPFLKLGAKKNLTIDDLFPVREIDAAGTLGDELEREWEKELEVSKKRGRAPSLIKPLTFVFWKVYFGIFILLVISECILQIMLPILLRWFIQSFGNPSITASDQYIYATAVCATAFLITVTTHCVYFGLHLICMRSRIALISMIYRKSLRLSAAGPNQTNLGHIVNLAANDTHRLEDAILFSPWVFIGAVQLIILSYILMKEIGFPALVGVGLLLLMIPVQFIVGKYSGKFQSEVSQRTDERARFMNEIITGIRVIKMYGWEEPFSKLIHKLRFAEVKSLKKVAYLLGFFIALNSACVNPVILVTMISYILMGIEVTADSVFFAVAVFNILLNGLWYSLPHAIMGLASAAVTLRRLSDYLAKEEQITTGETLTPLPMGMNSEPVITMRDVSASWTSEKLTLNKLNIQLRGDQIVMVIGSVGSGKSSFLNAIIGELPIDSGNCIIHGLTSYASQEAWIFTGTIRQNILFGLQYDESHYKSVVEACALTADFSQFDSKDLTVVGERGITLSGGQRARVNLARALYRKADIYLLDDPLSAVDARVSKHIVNKCIKNFLRGRLRVLITHQLQYLPKADHIIVLNQKGEIFAQGTFAELQSKNVDILNILAGGEHEEDAIEADGRRVSRTPSTASTKREEEAEVVLQDQKNQEEFMEYGKVTCQTYGSYFKASDSMCNTVFVFGGFILVQCILSGSYLWLSFWTNYEDTRRKVKNDGSSNTSYLELETEDTDSVEAHMLYLWIYVGFVLAALSSVLVVTISYFGYTMRIGVNIHDRMFKRLSRAPTKFFDTNPPGRILNRVTRDLAQIDTKLPETLYDALTVLLRIFGTVAIVISTNYYVLIPTGFAFLFFYLTRWYYVKTVRDVKRLEAISRSPIFTQLTSTYQGLATIRASKAQELVKQRFEDCLNTNTEANFTYYCTTRWFAVWLELSAVAYFSAITFGFLFCTTSSLPGSVGMAMVTIMELNIYFQWGMRQSTELENIMTCVERIQEYSCIEPEAPLHSEPALPKAWITKGEIRFEDVSLVFDETPVLNALSFSIRSQEKIGVVGRTGAGKSSIITALFRLTEPSGSIYIDNVQINDIGLHDLRQNVSIIPQEPQLFSGTMRYNLDPFNEFQDPDIWKALDEVALKDVVQQLDTVVADGGSNFSTGERQLVCLARAILRNNKILVMDEATANVDPKTDNFIQAKIRDKFVNCTIITIAHRLQTVMDCDRILVLEKGILMEYDHPYTLLQNPHGFLTCLINQTSQSTQRSLHGIAEENFKSIPE